MSGCICLNFSSYHEESGFLIYLDCMVISFAFNYNTIATNKILLAPPGGVGNSVATN